MRRPRSSPLLVALTCAYACATPTPAPIDAPAPEPLPPPRPLKRPYRVVLDPEGAALFARLELLGGALLVSEDYHHEVHSEELDRRYPPGTTFFIAAALIGLETGVIPEEGLTLQWSRKMPWPKPEHVEKVNLRRAMSERTVWYFQEVIRRIGPERMQAWIDRFDYGNRELGGGGGTFWSDGTLRISAREVVRFLRRLDADDLGVAPRRRAIVEDLLHTDRSGDYPWRSAFSYTTVDGETSGWYVGMIDTKKERVYHAMIGRIEREDPVFVMGRLWWVTRSLLARRALVPATWPGMLD